MMAQNIWDIITNSQIILNPQGLFAQDAGNEFVSITYEHSAVKMSDAQKEDILKVQKRCMEFLDELLHTKGVNAETLIKSTCSILYTKSSFMYNEDASKLSGGMLSKIGTLSKIIRPDDVQQIDDLIYDILTPNLFSSLLLEGTGQHNDETSRTLKSLWDTHSDMDLPDYPELSRTISRNFPAILKSLFDVKKIGGNKSAEYNIRTQYPELFLIILAKINKSPMASKEKAAKSLVSNNDFYDSCIDVIAHPSLSEGNDRDKAARSFEMYYLFERLFRLNTKFQLFCADFLAPKGSQALSPSILADFFFSSPLVFFPKNILACLFYEPKDDLKTGQKNSTCADGSGGGIKKREEEVGVA